MSGKRGPELEAAWEEGWDEGYAVGYWMARQELGIEDDYSRWMSRRIGADKGNASRRGRSADKKAAALELLAWLHQQQPTAPKKVHVSEVCQVVGVSERTLRRWMSGS